MQKVKNNLRLLKIKESACGFTLVEALMMTVLFAIVLGVCFMVLLQGTDSWHVNSVQQEVQQEARKAMDWIRQDLVEAISASITNVPADGAPYATITFNVAAGISGGNIVWSTDTIQYLRGGAGSTQLLRRSGGVDRIIAQDIQSLQFTRQASVPSVVEVSVQAQNSTPKGTALTANSNFKVKVRN